MLGQRIGGISRPADKALKKKPVPNARPKGQSVQQFAYPKTATGAASLLLTAIILFALALIAYLLQLQLVTRDQIPAQSLRRPTLRGLSLSEMPHTIVYLRVFWKTWAAVTPHPQTAWLAPVLPVVLVSGKSSTLRILDIRYAVSVRQSPSLVVRATPVQAILSKTILFMVKSWFAIGVHTAG